MFAAKEEKDSHKKKLPENAKWEIAKDLDLSVSIRTPHLLHAPRVVRSFHESSGHFHLRPCQL